MRLVLSGFAGVGKSTLVKKVNECYPNVFICPESAREVNWSNDFFTITDPNLEFFQKSVMDNEIMKLSLTHLNKIERVIYDRGIVDNLAFAEIFYGGHKINYNKIQCFVDELLDKYKINSLYDKIIFIKSSHDEEFIEDFILKDEFRKSKSADNARDFIKNSIIWEEVFFKIIDKLNNVCNDVVIFEHFTEDELFHENINKIFDDSFLIKK